MTEGILAIERFAEVNARVDAGEDRAELLSELGISAEEFSGAQAHWLGQIGQQVMRNEFKLQRHYASQYGLHYEAALRSQQASSQEPTAPPLAGEVAQPLPVAAQSAFVATQQAVEPATPVYAEPVYGLSQQAVQPAAPVYAEPVYGLSQQAVATPATAPATVPETTPVGGLGMPSTLSLEQMACIGAELELAPERADEVLAANGMDRAGYAAQVAQLESDMQLDANKHSRYFELRDYYRAVLAT